MKRSFTFTFSRKVSTAPYENADVFVAEGIEVDTETIGSHWDDKRFENEKAAIVKRVRGLADEQAEEVKA